VLVSFSVSRSIQSVTTLPSESSPIFFAHISYTAIVKKPMDLSTIQAKLDAGHYASRQDFVEDVRLIISNCFLYNDPGTEVYRAGQLFEGVFHKGELTL
jgi:hypothetical protein